MADTEEEKRQRIMAIMAAAINRPSAQPPQGPLADRSGLSGTLEPPPDQPAPAKPIVNLPLPGPNPVSINAPVSPAAVGSVGRAQPSPARIGYSTAGLTGVDSLMQRKKAYENADPESNVNVTPDFVEIEPPNHRHGFKGRLKALGEGALIGLATADPDHPMIGLGRGLGGAGLGAVNTRGEAQAKRKFDLANLDNDISRGLKLEQEQTQLGQMHNPVGQLSTRVVDQGEYPNVDAGTEIRVRVDPRTGAITDVVGPNKRPVISRIEKSAPEGTPHYDSDDEGYLITVQSGRAERVKDKSGNPVKVKSKNSDGEVVEVEVNGKTLKVTPGQALSYYGQIGRQDNKVDERESKRVAAQSEYDQLVSDEQKAGEEKNRAYSYLEQIKKAAVNDSSGKMDEGSKSDIAEATRAAEDANKIYQSFAEKKRDAQTRIRENTVSDKANEDAKVRSYADQFFGGDYSAADAAIKKQRGQ